MNNNGEVNRKRQVELDCAKGLAVVFMVWVHVNEYYQSAAYEGGLYNTLVEFLGSPPAAPVFMFLLGLGIVYGRYNSLQLAIRGVKFLVGGYVFSFFRDMASYLVMYLMEGDKELIATGNDLLWGIDIFQFAGLMFLFFAIIEKFKISNMKLLWIWSVFASLNMLLVGNTFSNDCLNRIFGLIWGTSNYSWFPFLNWTTYPIAGYIFGGYLIRCSDKEKLYKRLLGIFLSISIPLWIYSWKNDVQFGAFGDLWQQAYYHHDIIGNFVMISFVFVWISIIYLLTPHLPALIKNCLIRWGRNITGIYILSYLLITWSYIVLNRDGYAPLVVCLLALVIFGLSDFLVFQYKRLTSN